MKKEAHPAGSQMANLDKQPSASCDANGHCVTCSDEALEACVVRIDESGRLALVTVQDTTVEVDISLVDSVEPGDRLLVHGGVAIVQLDVP